MKEFSIRGKSAEKRIETKQKKRCLSCGNAKKTPPFLERGGKELCEVMTKPQTIEKGEGRGGTFDGERGCARIKEGGPC